MTTEEKAKAYDEALERLKPLYEQAKKDDNPIWSTYEYLIPELAESEDERIRKALIDALKTSKSVGELKFVLPEPTREECIAYLEKQKEQKVSVDDFKAKDWYVSKVDGKIHNIYYSVDKVKPKFKVGDKIIEKDFDECGRGTIIDIKDGKYIFDDGGFICIEEQGLWKLVEQKPAEWSEEDEEMLKDIISGLKAQKILIYAHENQGKAQMNARIDWLQSLPERFNLQPKQEWSEEEKEILGNILGHYVLIDKPTDANGIPKEKYISLIKSLRFDTYKNCNSHWKPSEEQMEALKRASMNEYLSAKQFDILVSLYEQLKNLM